MEEFVKYLILNIVKDPDSVSIKTIEDDNEIIFEIIVSNQDMGAVIGRDGKIVNAIRTLVSAVGYANGITNVKVNIDSI
jgi:hypothetical protein